MLRKCIWNTSYLEIASLSSEPFSNYDFIHLMKGSLDSWGGNGLVLNRYQRREVEQFLPYRNVCSVPKKEFSVPLKSEIESIMQPKTAEHVQLPQKVWAKLVSSPLPLPPDHWYLKHQVCICFCDVGGGKGAG